VGLKGNPNHPLNRGGLCPLGQAGLDVLYSPDRLTSPLRRAPDGGLQASGWEEALSDIGRRLADLRRGGEGRRIAVLTGEPRQLFHDLAVRFTHWLGSPNVARTEPPGTTAYSLTQGIDQVPGFDLEQTDMVLALGLDLYEDGPTPVHAIASMVGSRSTEERGKILHVGTRRSPTSTKAEEVVEVLPATYGAFALGVAHVLVREGRYDRSFVQEHTFGFEDETQRHGHPRLGFRRLLLERYYPDRAAQLCGCDPEQIITVARRFAEAEAPVAMAGGDATMGSNATWTVMAVQALNALMGSFDRAGGVVLPPPIPFTPLPDDVPRRPAAESILARDRGTSLGEADPVEALSDGVLEGSYPIDVLFIIGADPLQDSPAGRRLAEAMKRISMVVSLTPFVDDTAAAADVVLPTHVFLESWQESTTPATVAFATLGLASPVIEPLHNSRHPADVLLELGRRVSPSNEALPWADYVEYLRFRLEGLARSGQGSVVTGSFDDEWEHFLEERGWRFEKQSDGEELWNDLVQRSAWWDPVRSRGDWQRLFATRSGRYEFYSTALEQRLREVGAMGEDAPADQEAVLRRAIEILGLDAEPEVVCFPHHETPREVGEGEVLLLPFRPITGRGRLGVTSRMVMEMFGYSVLSGWETWAELAPDTANELDVGDGDRVRLESDEGSIEVVVKVRPGATGVIHVPLGLGHRQGYGAAGGIGSNPINVLLTGRDPVAGSLALGSTRVGVKLVERRLRGAGAPVEGGLAE
jgi:anaerobic selenocysteine-containing dehydrogenase